MGGIGVLTISLRARGFFLGLSAFLIRGCECVWCHPPFSLTLTLGLMTKGSDVRNENAVLVILHSHDVQLIGNRLDMMQLRNTELFTSDLCLSVCDEGCESQNTFCCLHRGSFLLGNELPLPEADSFQSRKGH